MFKERKYIAHIRERDGRIQYLDTHLKEVSKKAGEFAAKVGLEEYGKIIGFLHDIGKASKEFTEYIKSAGGLISKDEDEYINAEENKGKIDHSSAGAQIIYKNLSPDSKEDSFIAQILSLCIASHHSGLIDCIAPDGSNVYLKRMAKYEQKSHANEVFNNLDDEIRDEIIATLQSKKFIQDVLSRFKTLKTEHDSQETFAFKCGLLVRFIFSCLIDADRLNTADFEVPRKANLRNHGTYENWPVLINRMDMNLGEFKSVGINTVRQQISQACLDFSDKPKGLYQLTVPTGGGKTFASLRFALNHAAKHKMDRIIYILPYTTIIEQNAEAIRKILGEKNRNLDCVVLEHHSNLTPDRETVRQKILSENWDAPIILTTNVQILETLFGSGTRGVRRMHQIANAVVIFDEVQALPVKCVHMFNTAVNFLINNCGSTVVLCTATQPLLDKVEPKSKALNINSGQQMIQNAKQLFINLKRVEVYDERKVGGWTNVEIKELAEHRVLETSSVLVVANTKQSVRDIYEQCQQIKNVEVYHLSTHMCPKHRMAVLNKVKGCLSKKKQIICVSTQLIEAGVDISFGAVIRFLSGLDSIAQAAGRCNRHNEYYPKLGKISIINPAYENIDVLEDIKIGKEKAERLLDEYKNNPEKFGNNRLSPEAMEQYYQYYFFQRASEMNYPVGINSAVGRADNLFNLLSTNMISVQEHRRINCGKEPEIKLRQSFMTASKSFQTIETATSGIIVPYEKTGKEIINDLCSTREIDKQYQLIRQAQRYSVNVFSNILSKLEKQNAVHEVQKGAGILYLDERFYSDKFGLSEKPVKNTEFLSI